MKVALRFVPAISATCRGRCGRRRGAGRRPALLRHPTRRTAQALGPSIVVVMTDDQTVAQTRVMRPAGPREGPPATRAHRLAQAFASPIHSAVLSRARPSSPASTAITTASSATARPSAGLIALDQEKTIGVWLQQARLSRTIHVGEFLQRVRPEATATFMPPWVRTLNRSPRRDDQPLLRSHG